MDKELMKKLDVADKWLVFCLKEEENCGWYEISSPEAANVLNALYGKRLPCALFSKRDGAPKWEKTYMAGFHETGEVKNLGAHIDLQEYYAFQSRSCKWDSLADWLEVIYHAFKRFEEGEILSEKESEECRELTFAIQSAIKEGKEGVHLVDKGYYIPSNRRVISFADDVISYAVAVCLPFEEELMNQFENI